MKWLIIAAMALALLVGCAYMMISKQEEITNLVKTVQKYMGRRDALQMEVDELENRRDKIEAMRNEWIAHRKRAGELQSLYGDKVELESACKALTRRRNRLMGDIGAYTNEIAMLEKRVEYLEIQTNAIAKARLKAVKERDLAIDDAKMEREAFNEAHAKRIAEESRYAEQKKLADQEMERATMEKKRADAAKHEADDAERRKFDAEQSAKAAEAVQKARAAAARSAYDKETAELEKHLVAARKTAGVVAARTEVEQAKLKEITAEITRLEARRDELLGVEKQLAEAKASLAVEQEKLGQTKVRISAQQVGAQIDDVREDVVRRLGAFGARLEEIEKKQKLETKQGGVR